MTGLSRNSSPLSCLARLFCSNDVFVTQGVEFMSNVARKWWLGAALLLCLVPSSFAVQHDGDHPKHDKCKPGDKCKQNVPEGGTSAIYLLGASLACLGAMYVRARSSKPSLS
jgi:hypothetical protein